RAPFDLAEAESELVAGFHTEYSGLRWSFFFMAEYGAMFAVSGIATLLFLGGWHTGFIPWELSTGFSYLFGGENGSSFGFFLGNLINSAVFVLKAWVLVFVMMWVRWTLPRLRIDQVMMTCLKYLLPISCFLLLGVSFWEVAARPYVGAYFKFAAFGLSAFLLATTILRVLATPSKLPVGAVGASWAPHVPEAQPR
ncbi:MAG: NADH-quinone oxidoreductase subunit H, partial [Gemmataceae bacterium]|nr:NADH-quinone oxidoreductase subunit H [Gemmataceae bacterium]